MPLHAHGTRDTMRRWVDEINKDILKMMTYRYMKSSVKASQLDAFCHRPYHTVFNIEFKLSYLESLENLKLFSIRVKELFEPYSFVKQRRRVFSLFKSIFSRNRFCTFLAILVKKYFFYPCSKIFGPKNQFLAISQKCSF